MRIFIVGAGQVGSRIVSALHDEHELTVVDIDAARLSRLGNEFDVRTVRGNGASRRTLQEAGIGRSNLVIACTSRDEPNLIAAMLARRLAPRAKTIVRTTNVEYLEIWRERELDVDFMVSSELETALGVSRLIGVPAARQTDVFADGQVQIVEFDVEPGARHAQAVGLPLREARLPHESRVASIIRDGRMIPPFGGESIRVGDRVIVIGSPRAARAWSELMARDRRRVQDVVVFGAGHIGMAVARVLLEQEMSVRLIEADGARAREVAELLPGARVLHATGIDHDFLRRERIGSAQAAVLAMREDAKNLFAAVLARLLGVTFTIAAVHEPDSIPVFEAAGVDVVLDPRTLTAEEIVRFAHDPRTQQVAMLEGDRYEILDITCRPDSPLLGVPFRELPRTGAMVGAVIRDGKAIFPHGSDVLQPGDRAIVFTESTRVGEVEQAL